MIKRIIEISQAKTYLSVKYGQLLIKQEGEQVSSIPCEDRHNVSSIVTDPRLSASHNLQWLSWHIGSIVTDPRLSASHNSLFIPNPLEYIVTDPCLSASHNADLPTSLPPLL